VPPATRSGRLGAQAFDAFGPVGVVAVRQTVAAAVLLPVARPPLRRTTWPQWSRTLLLALVFATMYLTLYTAIDRIGLALAITPEVVGAVDPGRADLAPSAPHTASASADSSASMHVPGSSRIKSGEPAPDARSERAQDRYSTVRSSWGSTSRVL